MEQEHIEHESYLRQEVKRGLEQLRRGEYGTRTAEQIIAEERRRLFFPLLTSCLLLTACQTPNSTTPTPPATAHAPQLGHPYTLPLNPQANSELQWIPPGTFLMGSPSTEPSSKPDERPQTQVTLTRGFWLGKTIFTIGQWKAATGLDVRAQLTKVIHDDTLYPLGGKQQTIRAFMRFDPAADPSQYLSGEGDDLPMYFVSWNNAMEFCQELTERERAAHRLPAGYAYTLPTEAQFEYACRAGTTTPTYSAPLDQIAWYNANSPQGYTGRGFNVGGHTAGPRPVALKEPNAWGLYDMSGNLWQWCRDFYAPLPGGNVTDPTGPATGTDRVNRAGSFGSGPASERSAARAHNPPAEASAYRGFRLALAPVP